MVKIDILTPSQPINGGAVLLALSLEWRGQGCITVHKQTLMKGDALNA
jgi:hypothetical protein